METAPQRIQRKRTKGWRIPENTVCVTRGTRYGNPYKVGENGIKNASEAIALFEKDINDIVLWKEAIKTDLKGKNLACFCALDKPCHADILLKIANEL